MSRVRDGMRSAASAPSPSLLQAAGALFSSQNHPAFSLSALSTSRQGWGIAELNSEFAAASPNDTTRPFDAFA
jgi:hypothetical protein